MARRRTKRTTPRPSLLWKEVRTGSFIAVYWDSLRGYYPCKVIRKPSGNTSPKSKFFVKYQDNSKHWHDLAITKFRWLEDRDVFFDEEAEEDHFTAAAASDSGSEGEDPDTKSDPEDESTANESKRSEEKRAGSESSDDSGDESYPDQNASEPEEEEDSPGSSRKKMTGNEDAGACRKRSGPRGNGAAPSWSMKSTTRDIKRAHEKKEINKQEALLSILMVYWMAGTESVALETLTRDLGCHPRTKTVASAWKEICRQDLVEEKCRGKQKAFGLTEKGIDAIAPDDYKHQLANPPKTTEELQERIRSRAPIPHGATIFDALLNARKEGSSLSTKELAAVCGVMERTKSFVCALKQLRNSGHVGDDPNHGGKGKARFVLSPKCFLG